MKTLPRNFEQMSDDKDLAVTQRNLHLRRQNVDTTTTNLTYISPLYTADYLLVERAHDFNKWYSNSPPHLSTELTTFRQGHTGTICIPEFKHEVLELPSRNLLSIFNIGI